MALLDTTTRSTRGSIDEFSAEGRREAAHRLHDLGLPITLCLAATKAPLGKGWHTRIWTHDDIDAAFRAHGDLNVGLILGPRSGLIDLEVDGPGGERALLELFGGDVPVTPMWRSARGPHRLFQWHDELATVGKSSITIGSLELRLGANGRGAQSLLPPSVTDGWGRQWGVSLEDCLVAPLPAAVRMRLLDTLAGCRHVPCAGRQETNVGHSIAVSHNAVSHFAVSHLHANGHSKPVEAAIRQAIDSTMPGSAGYRNKLLLQFARQLKGIQELAAAGAEQLRPYVEEWWRQALPVIGTQDFDETWRDFVVAWGNVRHPAGEGPLDDAYRAALSHMPPIAREYRVRGVRNLIALCHELQRRAGDRPFFLACRPAAAVLRVPRATANRWLLKLKHDHVLELVTPGTRGRAAEYWCRGG